MKKTVLVILTVLALNNLSLAQDKLVSKEGSINFFSHTVAEDISSDNYSVTTTLEPSTGKIVFVVAMQGFEFEKALMQKHFNSSKFLDTKTYPKGKFTGQITNLSDINFSKNGTYEASVEGDLSIHGETKLINEKGTVTVADNSTQIDSKFKTTLDDFKIAFDKGKPSTNIAKEIDVTVKSVYKKQ